MICQYFTFPKLLANIKIFTLKKNIYACFIENKSHHNKRENKALYLSKFKIDSKVIKHCSIKNKKI